jgi:hypothetical protein
MRTYQSFDHSRLRTKNSASRSRHWNGRYSQRVVVSRPANGAVKPTKWRRLLLFRHLNISVSAASVDAQAPYEFPMQSGTSAVKSTLDNCQSTINVIICPCLWCLYVVVCTWLVVLEHVAVRLSMLSMFQGGECTAR